MQPLKAIEIYFSPNKRISCVDSYVAICALYPGLHLTTLEAAMAGTTVSACLTLASSLANQTLTHLSLPDVAIQCLNSGCQSMAKMLSLCAGKLSSFLSALRMSQMFRWPLSYAPANTHYIVLDIFSNAWSTEEI